MAITAADLARLNDILDQFDDWAVDRQIEPAVDAFAAELTRWYTRALDALRNDPSPRRRIDGAGPMTGLELPPDPTESEGGA